MNKTLENRTLANLLIRTNAAVLLKERTPQVFLEWLTGSLIEHLQDADNDTRNQNLSFAWALSALQDEVRLHQLAEILGSISSTSDVGIHTVVMNLLLAKAHFLEGNVSTCNFRWYIGGVANLDSLPEFRDKGYEVFERRLHEILNGLPRQSSADSSSE